VLAPLSASSRCVTVSRIHNSRLPVVRVPFEFCFVRGDYNQSVKSVYQPDRTQQNLCERYLYKLLQSEPSSKQHI
jgi:hypothetical protein